VDANAILMLRVQAGDRAAFDLLLLAHRTSIVQLLNRMVRNRAIAEELAQDVFLRVYRSRQAYLASARFTTWLHRIATNAALNWIRDQRLERRHERLDDRGAAGRESLVRDRTLQADEAMLWRARLDEVRDSVFALPPKQRAAVLMHKYHDLNYNQIADALGCSVQAVKSLLFRAYESLRARLRADEPDLRPSEPV
jgi:RNA polymerase sigma-70 factor (ECF subfamily)